MSVSTERSNAPMRTGDATTISAQPEASPARLGAAAAIAAAVAMVIGAILWAVSGTDLDGALADGTVAEYLVEAGDKRSLLVANLSVWILGASLFGLAGFGLSRLPGRTHAASAARAAYLTGAPVAVASFVAWLTVIRIAPGGDPASTKVGEALGFFASRGDWITTIMLVGLGPLLLSIAGSKTWAPRWLVGLGYAAGFTGLLTLIAMFAGGLATYGFLIVPIGLAWTLAAGVTVLRR